HHFSISTPCMGHQLPVPGQRLSVLCCSLSEKTTNRPKLERHLPSQATTQRKQAMPPREQRATVPGQKAVSVLARKGPIRRMGALALTRAAMPPLGWIPELAQREQARGRLLRRTPEFCR